MKCLRRSSCVVVFVVSCLAGWGKQHDNGKNAPPVPSQRISLDALGMEGTPTLGLLHTHAAIATLDFIDNDHLLLTYVHRSLQARAPGEAGPPIPVSASREREDRLIHAEVIDLHTAKIGEQRDWPLYDREWYLLALGGGEFLLRRGGELSVLDSQLNARNFSDAPQAVLYGQASGNVLVLELEHEAHTPEQHAQMVHDAKLFDSHPPVEQAMAYAWKLPLAQPSAEPLFHILLPRPETIAANPQGLLEIEGHDDRFDLFFKLYQPPQKERKHLFKLHSDCHPSASFPRQDVVLIASCKAGRPWNTAINLDGKILWQQAATTGALAYYSTSNDGTRLAVQSVGTDAATEDVLPTDDDFQRGTVQVFDVDTGARVFSTVLEPLYAANHTAALSPNGLRLSILRKGALEIYDLPPLEKAGPPNQITRQK